MNKLPIFLLLALLIVPFAFANFYTDTSRNYFTQKCFSGGTGNCAVIGGYMLNNFEPTYVDIGSTTYLEKAYNIANPNNNFSRIEYNSTDWDSCNLVLGGSEFRGLPFRYYDPYVNYTIGSFIRLRNLGNNSYIEQINSNCQVWDSYPTGENTSIVSQLGIINKGSSNGILPMFAFAYNNTKDGNVYMRVYQIDNSSLNPNLLEWLHPVGVYTDFFIADWEEFANYDNNLGVAGGGLYSEDNNPSANERVFGMFSKNYNDLFILYGKSTYPYFEHSELINVPNFVDNSSSHQLFYDDWDSDGNNEFILLSIGQDITNKKNVLFQLNRILPLNVAPYYYLYNEINYTNVLLDGANYFEPYNITDGKISLCQLGDIKSELEACYYGEANKTSLGVQAYTYFSGMINNSFTDSLLNGINSASSPINSPSMFSKLQNNQLLDNDIDLCLPRVAGDTRFKCYKDGGYEDEYFLSNNIDSNKYGMSGIIGELDGNYTTPEIIWKSGDVESIRWNNTNVDLPNWENTFTRANTGSLWLQDISGDNRNELIYMDDTFFRVYSMNNTPTTFLTYQQIVSSITTTLPGATTTTTLTTSQQTEKFKVNLKLIIAMGLILAIMGGVAWLTRSTIVTIFGGIIGIVLSVAFELISSGIIVILLISLIILLLLGLFLMKRGD